MRGNAIQKRASGRMDAAGFRRFTKHIAPVSLSFGVWDLDAPRLADAIECHPRSQAAGITDKLWSVADIVATIDTAEKSN